MTGADYQYRLQLTGAPRDRRPGSTSEECGTVGAAGRYTEPFALLVARLAYEGGWPGTGVPVRAVRTGMRPDLRYFPFG